MIDTGFGVAGILKGESHRVEFKIYVIMYMHIQQCMHQLFDQLVQRSQG